MASSTGHVGVGALTRPGSPRSMATEDRGMGLIGEDVVASSKLFSVAWDVLLRILEIVLEVLDFVW